MGSFSAFLLHESRPQSYEFLTTASADLPAKKPFKHIEHVVVTEFKSLPMFQGLESLKVDRPKIYECLKPLPRRGKAGLVVGKAKSDKLGSEDFPLITEEDTLEGGTGHYEVIIVFKTSLHFNLVIFEGISRHSYCSFGSCIVEGFMGDSITTIYDSACNSVFNTGMMRDPMTTIAINRTSLHKLDGQFGDYHPSEMVQLESDSLQRSSAINHPANARLETIKTSNVVFLFTATRTRQLRIPYVLFNSESEPYQFLVQDHVDVCSEDTAELLHDTVRRRIQGFSPYCNETRYDIIVYEPKEAFELAYGKQPDELESLKLEEGDFSLSNCSVLIPRQSLSSWGYQALIIVLRIPVQPQHSPNSTSFLDSLRHLSIGQIAPSTAAKLENYRKSQLDPKNRIMDDRPEKDNLIAPIPLLYQPFGYFRDAHLGAEVPGENDIRQDELWKNVGALADAMTLFYKSEEERSSKLLEQLECIFNVSPGTIKASKIRGGPKISDGHVDGKHGAMVFCLECKNELSAASCEPTAQLVSYIAASLKSQVDKHPQLFQRWRVPTLGVTNIGSQIQFFGVVWIGKMRVVPLTPSLPMVDPTGEELRGELLLAFKAAYLVFHKIQTDVLAMFEVLNDKEKHWPPVLTTTGCCFPSVTEIDIVTNVSSDTEQKKVQFVLESRYDEVEHRHLYHARLVSPALSESAIYVKFSQRYSIDLHKICASHGLAPKVLGFQLLGGGWFAVAMEKFETVDPRTTSFPEAGEWEGRFRELVNDFHGKGFVHGDLRLANFVFTKSGNAWRMVLVDFDWGGKEGEVTFPPEPLNEELGVSNNLLYNRQITKDHDRECLSRVFQWLNSRNPRDSGQAGLDTKPDQAMDG